MKRDYVTISLIMNIIIVLLVVFASIVMFTGIKFMEGPDLVLTATKLSMLRFFTVDSNLFMGVVALIFIYKDIEFLCGKSKDITKDYYILKLMATGAVSLTFFVVFAYLGPISKGGINSMLLNSNLFFHLVIPVLSILTFILFEGTNKLNLKDIWCGLLPVIIYSVFYITNIVIHIENGAVSPIYDWYWFVQGGLWTAFIVAPLILAITLFINLLLWRLNRIEKR